MSEWADRYELSAQEAKSINTPECREAIGAIHQMREKVLPRALKLISSEKPEWKNRVERVMEFKLDVRSWCPVFLWRPFYGDPANDGSVYFEMLGPEAIPAIPELMRLVKQSNPRIADRGLQALANIGPEGTAKLMTLLDDQENPHRRLTVWAFRFISREKPAPKYAVSCLVKSLNDQDIEVCCAAAIVLGNLGIGADEVVPALADCLSSPSEYLRSYACEALGKFGVDAHAAVPKLSNALEDLDLGVRTEATNALSLIAPEVTVQRR